MPKKSTIAMSSSTKVGKIEMARRARLKSMVGAMFDEEDEDERAKDEEQLQLTEKELKEEITRTLTSENPNALTNTVIFDYKTMAYIPTKVTEHTVFHIDIQNKVRSIYELPVASEVSSAALTTLPTTATPSIAGGEEEVVEEKEEEEEEEEEETPPPPPPPPPPQKELPQKLLRNKFNYNERAAQTYVLPHRDQETQTLPPPRLILTGNVSQGEIYDAYYAHAESLAREKKAPKKEEVEVVGEDLSKIAMTVKIMERMVNQNIYDEIMHDFKYWEDKADEYRAPEGMLLPLWKFIHDHARILQVSALCWNTRYNDLFAATYGSSDYTKQFHGMLCVYSLKNPTFPEYFYMMDSGLTCLDIHAEFSYLIAVGFFDGNVAVFDIKLTGKEPILLCDPREGKHSGPVWKVKWQPNNLDGNINFASISADGRVTNWVLFKSELRYSDVIHLDLTQSPLEGPGGASLDIKRVGTSLAFHRSNSSIFLVGTENGVIYQCSTVYSNRFLKKYEAHSMPVNDIQWNHYNYDIFISCSSDWTVKIWDYRISRPLFAFDLYSSVSDVAWAPYSATVFAACTVDGKIFVYDLHVNKYKAICEQITVQKKGTKLTSVEFNNLYPVLITGDSKGFTTCLKLSPNLRRAFKDSKIKEDPEKYRELEVAKLTKILAVVRLSSE